MDYIEGLHPLATVSLSQFQQRKGLPGDLSFAPPDSVYLFDTIQQVAKEILNNNNNSGTVSKEFASEIPSLLEKLDPDTYFSGSRDITRNEARTYESHLKQLLHRFANFPEELGGTSYRQLVDRVLLRLRKPVEEKLTSMEKQWPIDCYSTAFLSKNLLPLLFQLKRDDKLPVIVFNFDRYMCSSLATSLYRRYLSI